MVEYNIIGTERKELSIHINEMIPDVNIKDRLRFGAITLPNLKGFEIRLLPSSACVNPTEAEPLIFALNQVAHPPGEVPFIQSSILD